MESFCFSKVKYVSLRYLYQKEKEHGNDGKWLFEVGGKNKGFKQIKGIEDSYVVSDGIDIGQGKKIPLWMFGLLY